MNVLEALSRALPDRPRAVRQGGLAGVPVVRFGPACPATAFRVRPMARVRPPGVHPTGRIVSAQG